MKRRPFLHLAAATLTTGGCLGAARSPDAARSDAATDATRLAASEADAGRSLSVEGVETFEYVVRLNDLGDDPSGQVTDFSELADRERDVAATAIAGTYETRDPPEWLVRFVSATPFVEREGRYYRLENTFPTYRITAEAVEADAVEGEIASYREYEQAVTRENYVASGLLRLARKGGIELTYVWPALRTFLEAHEAVRYYGEVVSFSVEIEDSGPPYRVSGSRVAVSEAVGGSVWNVGDAPRAVRKLVRAAGRTRGAYGFDRAPEGFVENLRSHEYVALDGTFYTASVEKRGPVPVSLSARIRDGRLRLSARNESTREVALTGGPPRPFGVLRCHPEGDPDARRTLWTDAYRTSDRVRTAGSEVLTVADAALVTTLAPGETVTETYAAGSLPTGEYVVADSLGVRRGDDGAGTDGSSTLRYRVTFAVE